jgi:uracil-DNA glycosylase
VNVLRPICGWQIRAKNITPPEGTHILPARGGLSGPAFFPEGFGLQDPTAEALWPSIMAVGHNFGCEVYRNEINAAGREDDKATWRNLRGLLTDADVPIESCFMTNWFVGLQPGSKQVGQFLSRPDSRYERECSELLLEQMRTLKPHVILLLGLPVVGRAHRIMPALRPWADAQNWSVVDSSSLGSVAHEVEIPLTEVKTNVVALLHPSFSPSNQRHRRTVFAVKKPEVEMIRSALAKP